MKQWYQFVLCLLFKDLLFYVFKLESQKRIKNSMGNDRKGGIQEGLTEVSRTLNGGLKQWVIDVYFIVNNTPSWSACLTDCWLRLGLTNAISLFTFFSRSRSCFEQGRVEISLNTRCHNTGQQKKRTDRQEILHFPTRKDNNGKCVASYVYVCMSISKHNKHK